MHIATCMYLLLHCESQIASYLIITTVQLFTQGRIQDFLKGGSESGVDIEGGANPSIVSLKQGVWGRSHPEAMGYLILDSTKIPKNARL